MYFGGLPCFSFVLRRQSQLGLRKGEGVGGEEIRTCSWQLCAAHSPFARGGFSLTKLDLSVVGKQNVLPFDVAVNDKIHMEKLKGTDCLVENVSDNLECRGHGRIF